MRGGGVGVHRVPLRGRRASEHSDPEYGGDDASEEHLQLKRLGRGCPLAGEPVHAIFDQKINLAVIFLSVDNICDS